MRDPFRTTAKQQFVREAQLGMTAIAIVLAIFLYVAFHKITGRGRHLTDRVRNAPVAQPAWPRVNSSKNSARLPRAGLDVGAGQLAMNASNSRPTQDNRLSARPTPKITMSSSNNSKNHLDSLKPLTSKSKYQASGITEAQTKTTPPERNRLAGGILDSQSSLTNSIPGSSVTRDVATTNPAVRIFPRSDDARPLASSAKTSRPPSETLAPEPVAAKTFSNSDTRPNSSEPRLLKANEPRTADSSMPQIDRLNADRMEEKTDIQLTSAESIDVELAPQNDFEPKGTIPEGDFPKSPHPALPAPSVNRRGNGHAFGDGLPAVSSDDSAISDFKPAVGNKDSFPQDLPTRSEKSRRASNLANADGTWPSDEQKLFPRGRSKSDWPTAVLPSLRSPRPLSDMAPQQPQRFSGPNQEDIAKALLPDDSGNSNETGLLPTGTPAKMIPPRPATHFVREGDSYWTIAAEVYNDGRFFRALYEHNRRITPSFELVPGTKLATPLKSELIKLWPDHCPHEDSELTHEIENTSLDADRRIHVTKMGDTLFEIAAQKLGQASRYLEIYRLNQARLNSKVNHLSPLPEGVRLVLPPQ